MIDPKTVKRLRSQPAWADLQAHIMGEVDKLDRLPKTEGKDDRAIAVETAGREYARNTLNAILRPFLDFQEQPDATTTAQERAEDTGLD